MKQELPANDKDDEVTCATGTDLRTAMYIAKWYQKPIVILLWPLIWVINKLYWSPMGEPIRLGFRPLWKMWLKEKSRLDNLANEWTTDIRFRYSRQIGDKYCVRGRVTLFVCVMIAVTLFCLELAINMWIWSFHLLFPVIFKPFHIEHLPIIGPVDPYAINALFLVLTPLSWPSMYLLARFIVYGCRKHFW